ncbi:MAG: LysR substrate-binding domain-containing protein [Pseudomonadota bacterium]
MSYQLPPLPALRAFEAAARLGSFTAAARELNLTQAAVSHQVRTLESHLGFALFERLARSLRLTDMGTAYLPSVRQAFEALSTSTAGLFGPIGNRAITVRAPVSHAVLWLAPRLKSFLEAYPDIDVRLCSAIWADSLPAERIDLDIRFGDGRWPGHQAEWIAAESVVPLVSPDYLAARGPITQVADFPRYDLIHIMGLEDAWLQLFRSAALNTAPPRKGPKIDTTLAALELVAAGWGCALVIKSFAEARLAEGRLVQPIALELPINQAHYVVRPDSGEQLRPEALLFQDWLLAEARGEA